MKVAKFTVFNGDTFYIPNPSTENIRDLWNAIKDRYSEQDQLDAYHQRRMNEVTLLEMTEDEYHELPLRDDFPDGIFDRKLTNE